MCLRVRPNTKSEHSLDHECLSRPHCTKPCSTGTDHTEASFFILFLFFELAVDLGRCKILGERPHDDDLAAGFQQHAYDSAWAPTVAGGRGAGLEENCIKDPGRIKNILLVIHSSFNRRNRRY